MKTSGFTLVELILVIVLLSILSAVALPRFFGRSDFDERVFFDDTLNAIRYAQKVAVATGCQTQVVILGNSYTLLREDNCNGTSPTFSNKDPVINPVTGPVVDPVTGSTAYTGRQSGVNLTPDQTEITFDSLGRLEPSNIDHTIAIGNGDRQISIIAATGFSYDSTP